MTDLLKAALDWAQRGYPVFPCNPTSKSPLTKDGFKSATTDMNTITEWWTNWPAAMIGVPTGADSGFWVLDIDDPATFEAACPVALPQTRRHDTGKGYHLLFAYTGVEVRNAQRIGGNPISSWPFQQMPGAEVRGEGGYVIVPPSMHPSGKRYTVGNSNPIAEAPLPLLNIVTQKAKPLKALHAPAVTISGQSTSQGTPEALAALEALCEQIRRAPNGSQEVTLNNAGLKASAFVAMSQLSPRTAREKLIAAGNSMVSHNQQDPWRPELITKKVERAIRDGLENISAAGSEIVSIDGAVREEFTPVPLFRELAAGQPYPTEALGPLRDAVETVQALTQAPVALAAQSALTVTALAVQGFANVETLGGDRPTSIYAVTIAESGERKSTCDQYFMSPVRKFEEEQAKSFSTKKAVWEMRKEIWKDEHKGAIAKVKESGDSHDALMNLKDSPIPPRNDDRIVSEPTYEGLTRLFFEGQPSLGIFSDEGGRFLGGYAMSNENRMKTMAALNDLWGGNPIKRTRQGDGSMTLSNRRLSVHLMVQPVVANPLLADPLASGSGFLARCLVSQPPSTIGTRMHKAGAINTSALDAFHNRMAKVLRTPYKMDQRTGALELGCLKLSSAAHEALVAFADEVEAAQMKGKKYDSITSLASKCAEHAARLAGVMALWSNVFSREVTGPTMKDAIVLARYYLEEGLRLFGEAQISESLMRADSLLKWMLSDSWSKNYITLRDVMNSGPRPLRTAQMAKKAIQLLEEHHWLVAYPSGTVLDGARRSKAWRIIKD